MRRLLAEFTGTFVLVFAGTGAMVLDDLSGGALTNIGVSAVFFVAVAAMVLAFGGVSGAHINPAVTIGCWAAGRLPAGDVPGYVAAQSAGAVLASTVISYAFPAHTTLGATLPVIPVSGAFTVELGLTLILLLVILTTTSAGRKPAPRAGFAIGATVGLSSLFAGPLPGRPSTRRAPSPPRSSPVIRTSCGSTMPPLFQARSSPRFCSSPL